MRKDFWLTNCFFQSFVPELTCVHAFARDQEGDREKTDSCFISA